MNGEGGGRLVFLNGPEAAALAFARAGFEVRSEVVGGGLEGDLVVRLPAPAAPYLRAADERGLKYTLVHVGPDDGEAEGSYQRAHHRLEEPAVEALARTLATLPGRRLRCLAFGYKQGLPTDANWVIDVRFLDNPYWVEELRPLDGFEPRVVRMVLSQSAATDLLAGIESVLRKALPLYQKGQITVAFGCTGGRHRSVVMARALADRLADLDGFEVEFAARDLGALRDREQGPG